MDPSQSASRMIVRSQRGPATHPLIIDIGIFGGLLIADVVYERVLRPNFRPFVIGLYRNVHPCIGHMRTKMSYIGCRMTEGFRTARQFSYSNKSYLIRWLAAKISANVFTPTRRIYIWMNSRADEENRKSAGGVRIRENVNDAIGHHLARVSFRYIPELGDLDDCNEDGLIHAYEKASSSSDVDETDDIWSQVDPNDVDLEEVDVDETERAINIDNGTINITSFDPKRNARSSTPVKLTFPKEYSGDSISQFQQSEAKVAALEAQLNEMKTMIALILENQNKTMSHENNASIGRPQSLKQAPGPPPPPPPPPPPMPSAPLLGTNSQLKLKVGRKSGTLSNEITNSEKAQPQVKSMTDVLKGLGSVKLKPTPRSPGGTPLKRQKVFSPTDPSSMIANALKKRFARIHSPTDSESEDGSATNNCNKENKGDESNDSFDNSPLFRKAWTGNKIQPTNLFQTAVKRRSSLKETDGLKSSVIPEESTLLEEDDTILPLFGQHLLKPTTSTLLKQSNSPLAPRNQNLMDV